eukprot:CAMPEP_0117448656 /NCGR_PEP_ID=MMETSP0759-20121206/7520_1 /TAXON_ID=63605 /ORGANISM="Percolomonas cosmopolitus, Strain WS" /LENGTH=262 /DNA_ID=CAMNT_0005241063 /DNA_START=214 /DNA_END=1003 /DNA_ORIENTATION=-
MPTDVLKNDKRRRNADSQLSAGTTRIRLGETSQNVLAFFMLVAFLLFAGVCADPYNMQLDHTCQEDTYEPFKSTSIENFCPQYDGISCCTSEIVFNFFRTMEQDFNHHITTQADIAKWNSAHCDTNDFWDRCNYAKRGLLCFRLCATDQVKSSMNWNNGTRVCSGFANWLFDMCQDEHVNSNCSKVSNTYPTVEDYFLNVFDMQVVDGDVNCFNGAPGGINVSLSSVLLLVGIVLAVMGMFEILGAFLPSQGLLEDQQHGGT